MQERAMAEQGMQPQQAPAGNGAMPMQGQGNTMNAENLLQL